MKFFTGILSLLILSLMTVQAMAIPATPSGWMFQSAQTSFSTDGEIAYLTLNGHTFTGFHLEQIEDFVDVTVRLEEEVIPGELTKTLLPKTLIWRPSEDIKLDQEYVVTIASKTENQPEATVEQRQVVWREDSHSFDEMALRRPTTELYRVSVRENCDDEYSWADQDGCGQIIANETHWRVEAAIEMDTRFNQFALGRIAVGETEEDALANMTVRQYQRLTVEDAAYLRVSGGNRNDWDEPTACLALEVITPLGETLYDAIKCFDIPGTATKTETEEFNRIDARGCEITTNSLNSRTLWLVVLTLAIAWSRKYSLGFRSV